MASYAFNQDGFGALEELATTDMMETLGVYVSITGCRCFNKLPEQLFV